MLRFLDEDVKHIFLELTNKCKLACPSCSRTPIRKKLTETDLTTNDIEKLLSNYNTEERSKLAFFISGVFGDPIYHSDFVEIYKFIKDQGSQITIVTNGSGKDQCFWSSLAQLTTENDTWYFSIDGLEDTNSIYRINGNFKESFDAMTLMSKTKAKVIWKFIVFPHNKHQVEAAEKIANEMKVEFEIYYTDRTNNPKKYIIDDSTIKSEQLKKKEQNKIIYKKIWPKYEGNLSDLVKIQPKCILGQEPLFVSAKGHVLPCCRSYAEVEENGENGDYFNKFHHEWNLKEYPLEEILNHHFYANFREMLENRPEDSPYICIKNCGKLTGLGKQHLENYLLSKQPSDK